MQLASWLSPLTTAVAKPAQLVAEPIMLWTFIAVLFVLWLLGWSFHVAGNLIHVLLVLALIFGVVNLLLGKRTV